MNDLLSEIPTWFWSGVGIIVVANIGTMGTVALFFGRVIWWGAQADGRIDKAQSTGVRAHKRCDKNEVGIDNNRVRIEEIHKHRSI